MVPNTEEMSAPKHRKVDSENRSFKERWELDYFFVKSNGKPLCLLCSQMLAVCKEYNVKRHYISLHEKSYSQYTGDHRVAILNELRSKSHKQETATSTETATDTAALKASFLICEEIVKRKQAFDNVEVIKECAIKMARVFGNEDMAAKFDSISLQPQTVARRVSVMHQQITRKLHAIIKNCSYFSLALDENTDCSGTDLLVVFIRAIDDRFNVSEDILKCVSLPRTAKEEELLNEVKSAVLECGGFDKCTSVTTNGSKSMTSKNLGLSALLRKEGADCVVLHCIMHEETLVGTLLKMSDIMEVVIKISNFILERKGSVTKKKFKIFLDELSAAYVDSHSYRKICWSSAGRCLYRFFSLRKEIYLFLKDTNYDPILTERFCNKDFLSSLAFLTDITHYLHSLKKNVEAKDQLVTQLYTHISVFSNKLMLLKLNLISNDLSYFESCNELYREYEECNIFLDFGKFVEKIEVLIENFNLRFQDFSKINSSFKLYNNPLTTDIISEKMEYHMELCNLQADLYFATRKEVGVSFFRLLPKEKYRNLRDLALRMTSMFGSTYICEKAFSELDRLKSNYRNSISNRTLQEILHLSITNINLNFDELVL
ncbi:general transcription factor II-I repeat domain-containing protein 2B isoform X2 [Xenopus laevis]|nr:general transcription factor II-I repeat domain-containing protein 2B isoform X2 [Xenopus laevis]XP_041416823.1 general transcription factor II-I repeat domain-containing protein 2B isoform X2 [Xenopus laevis]